MNNFSGYANGFFGVYPSGFYDPNWLYTYPAYPVVPIGSPVAGSSFPSSPQPVNEYPSPAEKPARPARKPQQARTLTTIPSEVPPPSRQPSDSDSRRYSPYVSKPPHLRGAYPTTYSTKSRSKFNVLVVPTLTADTAAAPTVTAINIRRPAQKSAVETSSGASSSAASPAGVVHKYESTLSNRLGLTGPLSRQTTHNKAAHSEGIGKYLLQKMGWSPGSGIGTRPNGDCEPLASQLDFKNDKKGLGIPMEGSSLVGVEDIALPVAYLNETCLEKDWRFPQYVLVDESGPPHAKSFLYSISLNGVEYSAPAPATTKKQAKANAARACLISLGFIQK